MTTYRQPRLCINENEREESISHRKYESAQALSQRMSGAWINDDQSTEPMLQRNPTPAMKRSRQKLRERRYERQQRVKMLEEELGAKFKEGRRNVGAQLHHSPASRHYRVERIARPFDE